MRRLGAVLVVVLVVSISTPALSAEPELTKVRRERAAVQRELEATVRRFSEAEARLGKLQNEIGRVAFRLESEQKALDSAQTALANRADLFYRLGPARFLSVLLDANALSDFYRRVKFLERASEGDSARLLRATRARNSIKELNADLISRRDRERRIVQELRTIARDLSSKLGRAGDLERRLLVDEQEKARQAELAQRRAATAASTARRSAGVSSGRFVCPVQGPHVVTNSFGDPRSGGRIHQGIDIMASRGTPLAAVVDGTILRMNSSTLGGISLYLRGGDGTEFFYTHLNGYAGISQGSRIPAGTTIAYVGSTGNASASSPHLHFEIHPGGGRAIDPYPTVKAACG